MRSKSLYVSLRLAAALAEPARRPYAVLRSGLAEECHSVTKRKKHRSPNFAALTAKTRAQHVRERLAGARRAWHDGKAMQAKTSNYGSGPRYQATR